MSTVRWNRSCQRVYDRPAAIETGCGDTEGIYICWNSETPSPSVKVGEEVDQADNGNQDAISVNDKHAAVVLVLASISPAHFGEFPVKARHGDNNCNDDGAAWGRRQLNSTYASCTYAHTAS